MSTAAEKFRDGESGDVERYIDAVGLAARRAARLMASAATKSKDTALRNIAALIEERAAAILEANRMDLDAASDLDAALLDRLELNDQRVSAMAAGLRQVADLDDPIGTVSEMTPRPSGIQVGRMRVPLGVVGIIFESRPNVTADAAALCLKSGNAAILRGGSEALNSNRAIAECIDAGLAAAGLPRDAVQVIATTDRAAVGRLLQLPEYVDVIVPRGGKGLIERVSREARMPVIKHLDGVCHVYIDGAADHAKAIEIADNSKTQRYGTCNTMETLLLDEPIAPAVLPELVRRYTQAGVELRGCARTRAIVTTMNAAQEQDWYEEYLAPILAIRVVRGVAEAIAHISQYGSQHTDAIVTENLSTARQFLTQVDSSSVLVNASTRFADGFEYGLGAEIGISTDKFHARGPVGLEGLTSQKWIVIGDGHVRS